MKVVMAQKEVDKQNKADSKKLAQAALLSKYIELSAVVVSE